MATVSDGQNPGRSSTPQRQAPSTKRNGAGGGPSDPTVQKGQLPDEIFGFSQNYHTGAPGSGGAGAAPSDVTVENGQLEGKLPGLSVTEQEVTSTGLHGSQGHSPHSGGEGVRYTDPFGYMGNDHRESHASGNTNGAGDWTTWGDDNGFSGATLPVLEGCRPTTTGAGEGHVGVKHPNAGA